MRCIKCSKEINSPVCEACGYDVRSASGIRFVSRPAPAELESVAGKDHSAETENLVNMLANSKKQAGKNLVDVLEKAKKKAPVSDPLSEFQMRENDLLKYLGSADHVVVPEGITRIRVRAFEGKSVRKLVLPKSLKMIGACAFQDCTKLEQITLSEGLEEIDAWAFQNCSNLTQLTLPGTLRKLHPFAFDRWPALNSLVFEEGIRNLELPDFTNCINLKRICIPDSLTNLRKSFGRPAAPVLVEASRKCIAANQCFFKNNPYFAPKQRIES